MVGPDIGPAVQLFIANQARQLTPGSVLAILMPQPPDRRKCAFPLIFEGFLRLMKHRALRPGSVKMEDLGQFKAP